MQLRHVRPCVRSIDRLLYCLSVQIPKRLYSLEELRLNNIDATKFLSPSDDRLARIRTYCQACTRDKLTKQCCA